MADSHIICDRIWENPTLFYFEYEHKFTTLNIGNSNGYITKCCSSLMVQLYIHVDAQTCTLVNSDIDAKYNSKISILMEYAKCWIFPDPVT